MKTQLWLASRPWVTARASNRTFALAFLVAALLLAASAPLPAELRINEAVASNVLGLRDEDDKTSDWIEIVNDGPEAIELSGYGLSDSPSEPLKWVFPNGLTISPGDYRLVFASGKERVGAELHTNFKLSAKGETLVLSDASGVELDRLETGRLFVDRSIGRAVADPATLLIFGNPTPHEANTSAGFAEFVDSFGLNVAPGFYTEPVAVSLVAPPPGAELYYTLDGSAPTEASTPWPGTVVLSKPVNALRVRAFEDGKWPSAVASATYFLNPDPNLPVLSLMLGPSDLDELWDDPYAENEVPMHVELMERDGTLGFAVDIGAELFGFGSRANAQKSFQLKPRGGYVDDVIAYRVFPSRPTDEFRRLILRNSGNDWLISQLRDGVSQGLVDDDRLFNNLAFRSAVTYVNGEYWGLYNLREHHDVFYTETYHGEDTIDMLGNGFLQSNAEEIEGDSEHYDAMIDFMDDNDLGIQANYEYIQTQMDTDQFAAYSIAEIFVGNTDWPGNNIKYWRPKREGGRWQWMLFDTDFGLGFDRDVDHDTLFFALRDNGPFWPNPPWSTKVLRNLVESPIFERDFINRYADYLNTRFLYSVTRAQLIEKAQQIAPEIGPHMLRWEGEPAGWPAEIRRINDYLRLRVGFARQHIEENFELDGTYFLSLDAEPPGSGQIRLTAITPDLPFEGAYFRGVPVRLTAEPANGFAFAGWSDPNLPQETSVLIGPSGDYAVKALFEPGNPVELVVNEINYNSSDSFDPGDWIELYNPGNSTIDLGGWSLKDDQNSQTYSFSNGTVLGAGGYLVICEDLAAFESLFPQVNGALGDLGFGLGGGGDQVRVFDDQGVLRDLVAYDDEAPWPTEPDGNGPTLELTDPGLNNNDGTSWATSEAEHGSPGAPNGHAERALTDLPLR